MAEYIDREDVYNTMKAMYCDECTDEKCQMCEYAEIIFVLDNLPIADVQPVKHGRWEQIGEQNAKCTDCGGVLRSNGIDKTGKALIFNAVYHYCPFCGARMDGEQDA